MRLTPTQIYGYARGAGFGPASAVIATAVALAESGGRTDAHNTKPPDNSYGLWQINMLGDLGPARRAQFGLASNDQLFQPATNARAAYAISRGGKSFGAWSTFTSGAYLSELPAAQRVHGAPPLTGNLPGAATAGGGTAGADVLTGSNASLNLNPLDGFGVFGVLKDQLGKDLGRIALVGTLVAGGVALVVVGLYRAVQPTVQKVANVAGDAAKTAAIA